MKCSEQLLTPVGLKENSTFCKKYKKMQLFCFFSFEPAKHFNYNQWIALATHSPVDSSSKYSRYRRDDIQLWSSRNYHCTCVPYRTMSYFAVVPDGTCSFFFHNFL